jgi:cellobiose-specific phosphotransferase system component IIB
MKHVFLIIALLISTSVMAQSIKTPIIEKKQNNQINRIEQGVKSGELTKHETKVLLKQEAKLQQHKKMAKADGVITKKERAILNKEANKLSSKIYKQKHDKQQK